MADYKRMYAILCAAASEALDLLPELPENGGGTGAAAEGAAGGGRDIHCG